MRSFSRCLTPVTLAAAFMAPALTGCAGHARVYDSYDHQYHAWAPERSHYTEWEHETHKSHKDYKKRSADEQKQYWQWRQSH